MNPKEAAALYDAEERPVEAIAAYEAATRQVDANIDSYINLAVLYFSCFDLGYAAYHKLPKEIFEHSLDHALELLDEAEQRFGRDPDVEFWRLYMRFIYLEDSDEQAFYRLATTVDSLLPYLYLYAFTFDGPPGQGRHPEVYRSQAEQLLELVKEGMTEKDRYIRSVLEAALRHTDGLDVR